LQDVSRGKMARLLGHRRRPSGFDPPLEHPAKDAGTRVVME